MRDEKSEDGRGWARFALDGKHRYRLARSLGDEPLRFRRGRLCGERRVVFVMLNPSTADAFVVDPTIRRCVEFATGWGADIVEVVNLFAYRTPHPTALLRRRVRGDDARADAELLAACLGAHRVIAAWGNHGDHPRLGGRALAVTAMLRAARVSLMCLETTLSGAPKHPHARGSHRIPPDRKPIVWGV